MNKIRVVLYSIMVFLLAACGGGGGGGGGGSGSFTVGGSLSGMGTGKSIVLQNNAGDNLTLTNNGSFTFATALADGAAYAVTVATPPNGHTCTVSNGSGTVSGANVTNVSVSCVGEPSDNFVISGNNGGTLSILLHNEMTGYATTIGYYYLGGSGFNVQDMVYDEPHQRLFVITTNDIYVLGWDNASGITQIDTRGTSSNSSHLAVNAAGTVAYVASGQGGSNERIDIYHIGSDGNMTSQSLVDLTVDPDYIKLSPDGSHLYVVSNADNSIMIFGVNSDGSLASPTTMSTATNPSALAFNQSGSRAYLTRNSNSTDSLVTYTVSSTDGSLTQGTSYSHTSSPLDMVVSADGGHLYVLDGSNKRIDHYTIASNGDLTYDTNNYNVSFTATDLALSYTGAELYVGHSQDDLVSTFAIDSTDGTLTAKDWVRTFNSVNAVAAIGGNTGPLQPTARRLIAPDTSGQFRFEVASDGMLNLVDTGTSTGALIDGDSGMDYQHGLLLAAGMDASTPEVATLSAYSFNPITDALSPVNSVTAQDTAGTTLSGNLSLKRVQVGGAGRVFYALYSSVVSSDPAYVYSYAYAADGTIDPQALSFYSLGTNREPENLRLHPAGKYLYSVNAIGDGYTRLTINPSDGKISTGLGTVNIGNRPLDLAFHPNGRYAYMTMELLSQVKTYTVSNLDGSLGLLSSTTIPTASSNTPYPGPVIVHPNGKYVYAGDRSDETVVVFKVETNYTLTYQSRIPATGPPSDLEIDPQGKFLITRHRGDEKVDVYSINANGDLNQLQSSVVAGDGTNTDFMPTVTLVSPMQ